MFISFRPPGCTKWLIYIPGWGEGSGEATDAPPHPGEMMSLSWQLRTPPPFLLLRSWASDQSPGLGPDSGQLRSFLLHPAGAGGQAHSSGGQRPAPGRAGVLSGFRVQVLLQGWLRCAPRCGGTGRRERDPWIEGGCSASKSML